MSRQEPIENFVVLEGLDGSGTTTQANTLCRAMQKEGIRHWLTAEPTDGPIGLVIRDALHRRFTLEPETLAMLYAADRNEHLYGRQRGGAQGIVSRATDEWVVCDRYLFSSLAYQTIDCGTEFVAALNARYPLPRHLFYIDVDPAECARRRSSRDSMELFDAIEFQTKVHRTYREVLDRLEQGGSMHIVRIDGRDPAEEIAARIWSELDFPPINRDR